MPSSIFGQNTGGNSILEAVNALRSASQGDPQALYAHLYQNNPQFRTFADSMSGKTPEQAFGENGFDFDEVRNLLR